MPQRSSSFLLILMLTVVGARKESISVTREAPTSARCELDPNNPPPEKAQIAPDHDAFTSCNFSASWDIRFEINSRDTKTGKVTVTLKSIELNLKLHSDLWLPKNAPAALVRHEEGHQRIAEDAYGGAERIARQIAGKMIGNRYIGTGSSDASADQSACDAIGKEWLDAYLIAVRDPSQRVHDIYDQITDHGNNRSIAEEDAVKQAIQQFRNERKRSQPSTGPSDR